jgi:hypothetical protein
MIRRLLNIASIVCVVLCVVLMGMWVRSYCTVQKLNRHASTDRQFEAASIPGRLLFAHEVILCGTSGSLESNARFPEIKPGLGLFGAPSLGRPLESNLGFAGQLSPYVVVMVPFWFLVLVSGSLAMLFQLRWPPHFSLRTLLIATTFLAVVLGMITWLDRAWIEK